MTSTATPPANRTRAALTITAAIVAVVVVLFFIFSGLYTDVLWFDQLGYLPVLTTQWTATASMFLVGFFGMAIPVYLSIEIAFRARPTYAKLNSQLDRYQQVIEPLRRLAMFGIPVVLGVFAGVSAATRWPAVLQFLNRTPFGEVDPQFGLDIGFYFFELPFYRGVVAFASAVVLIAGVAALATTYLYGAIRVAGREVRISRSARVQIAVTAALYVALQAVSIWLDQYTTLTAPSDGFIATGAGYTEANATIPGKAILAGIAALVAILFIVTAIIGRWRLPVIGTVLLVVSSLVIGSLYPYIVQTFQVRPNARSFEAEYIQRNIEATRDGYGVSDVEEEEYEATTDAEQGALREDAETTANIRIIDPALVSDSFAQLERTRQYYTFAKHLDVDRYTIDDKTQDTVIAVRELDQKGLSDAQSWYNSVLVYTHGYGVVAAYGNQRTPDGQPVFLESGIPSTGELGEFEPRVYFGENSPEYSIVGGSKGTDAIEHDYPLKGDDTTSATTTFSENGGPKLDNIFKKLIYSIKYQSTDVLLSDAVTDDSQILYDRNPVDRVKKVAPYLTTDTDPYPAVVDGELLWIVDAYTTSANYPYSTTQELSSTIADTNTAAPLYAADTINYIRNSVKATVNAYTGEVTLYAWDENDPLLATWQKIFPSTLKSADDMSADLLSHVRYPSDLFKVQRAILGSYHVTDTNTFFSGNDQWATPDDPTSDPANPTLQPAYYLTMQLPGADEPGFTLYSSYIPRASASSTSNNLTGYLAVNSDVGKDYGKLTLLTLPSTETVAGPGQVQNNFSSDTVVANELAVIKRGDTDVLLGNLLTLPVGGGLLYVQPVYVQATGGTSYPLLRKVLVGFGDQIAFEDTLDLALDSLFGGDSGASAGDGEVDPSDPTDPTDPETPTDPGTGSDNPELTAALKDAQAALAEREAAYAKNDLVAAAQADKKLTAALAKAIAASK